jgi:small subunit ribosomal protein S16
LSSLAKGIEREFYRFMLAIRMQRTGRKGHAMYRVVVQDSHVTPTSGKVVALIGNYNPHAKSLTLNKEKAAFYLEHGAQPSDRAARLMKKDGVKLPGWVKLPTSKDGSIRHPEKRRATTPAPTPEPPVESPVEPIAEAETTPAPSED